MLFDTEIILKKNTTYAVWAKITGPNSLRGENGIDSVKCREITFTFINTNCAFPVNVVNATDVQMGQFPELLFAFK